MLRISEVTLPAIPFSRRTLLTGTLGAFASFTFGRDVWARPAAFDRWVEAFRPRALKRGISEATYNRVMGTITPDTSVYAHNAHSPNLPSRCGSTSIAAVRNGASIPARSAPTNTPGLLSRLEKDYGVDRYTLLGLWGMESSFGDVVVNPKYYAAG